MVSGRSYSWIITYGVETDPVNRKIGAFTVKVAGGGHADGDDNVKGRCNGTSYTAFRNVNSSFANPNKFGKGCCWDSGLN